ncbi:hypothetical protein [Caulifigura coniformis]|uniref:hypothetical protein n=1 Tax=Caulifigura coniformis TaxID=2527983 RepID=UPI0011A724D7|nr:hypothetical protein [Caulifigura coniformis]
MLEDRHLLSASETGPGTPQEAPPFPLNETFLLNSLPGSTKTIYLDFTGHTTSGTNWNTNYTGGADIVSPAFSVDSDPAFSDIEREVIQNVWRRVAEDYAPFDINVTTQDPGVDALVQSTTGDTQFGIRVVIGGSSLQWHGATIGGVAALDSFRSSSGTPAFVFSQQLVPVVFVGDIPLFNSIQAAKSLAEASSHEAGHTLGVLHDGLNVDGQPGINPNNGDLEYYTGHAGAGSTGWAPIMGNSYNQPVTQWSRGEYLFASRTEDDLALITGPRNGGVTYRTDDYASTREAAKALTQNPPQSGVIVFSRSGIIERNTDQDWFWFTTTGGSVSLNFDPAALGANLDILASIYDSSGQHVATSNPADLLSASFSLNLAAGTYSVMVDGVGVRTPNDGYSDYGSLGQYTITGSYPGIDLLPTVSFETAGPLLTHAQSVVYLNFSENVTGVTLSDFRLTRNGVNVNLAGSTLTQIAPDRYMINLHDVTEAGGDYVLTLRAAGSGITDASGQAYAADTSVSWINRQVTSFVVQSGQTQRSFINRLEVTIAGSFDLADILSNNRIRLRRFDLEGTPLSAVTLADYGQVTRVGNRLIFDFGEKGIGGNRFSTAGDGYYELRFDFNEDGVYDTPQRFYRLMGDVNGDRVVTSQDSFLVQSNIGQPYNPLYDMDGNGLVDTRDRIVVLRSMNRRLNNMLILDG